MAREPKFIERIHLAPGGFRNEHIYPLTPDVAKARRLAGPGRHTAVLYYFLQPGTGGGQLKLRAASLRLISPSARSTKLCWLRYASRTRRSAPRFCCDRF